MTNVCPVCQAKQDAGLLCSNCCDRLERDLGDVAAIVGELDTARSKQARIGNGGGKSGTGWAREKSPINDGAIKAHDHLSGILVSWARDVSDETWLPKTHVAIIGRNPDAITEGPYCLRCPHRSCQLLRTETRHEAAPVSIQAAWLLLSSVPQIRRHPAVEELVDEIESAIKKARYAVDRPADRVYFGACYSETPDEDGRTVTCLEEIWARPQATAVVCQVCSTEWEIAERRAWLLQRAEDMLVTVPQASEYIGEIGRIKVTQASIRGHVHRGRIAYRAPIEAKRIRLGDLLAVLLDESEKAERKSA